MRGNYLCQSFLQAVDPAVSAGDPDSRCDVESFVLKLFLFGFPSKS